MPVADLINKLDKDDKDTVANIISYLLAEEILYQKMVFYRSQNNHIKHILTTKSNKKLLLYQILLIFALTNI